MRVDEADRISVSQTIASVLDELRFKRSELDLWSTRIKALTLSDAELIKKIINEENWRFGSLLVPDGDTHLSVDYLESNLKIGYIFYFVCLSCEKRARYLYRKSDTGLFRCRTCHDLKYKRTKNYYDKRALRKLLRNPEVLMTYLNSSPKYYQVAAEALQNINEHLNISPRSF